MKSSRQVEPYSGELDRDNSDTQQQELPQSTSHDGALALFRAEQVRCRTTDGLAEYEARFKQQLRLYTSQRAWKIMLLFRKAYTLLVRQGIRGKLDLLKWILTFPFSGAAGLEDYELTFPPLSNYLPEQLHRSFLGGRSSPEAPDSFTPTGHQIRLGVSVSAQTKYDLLILAIVEFDFPFQRPQQIAAQFAREGHRVFWISPTRFLPPSFPEPYKIIPLRDNLWEIQLRGRPLDIYLGDLEADTANSLAVVLGHLYRDWAISESCLIVELPFWRQLALALRNAYGSKIVYDCMDDWEVFPTMGLFNVSEEKRLVKECDLVLVTSQELVRKFKKRRLQPLLVRNGADFDFFRAAAPNDLMSHVAKPIIGYFGGIAEWVDLDLIYEVARLRPHYSLVLIGKVFDCDISKLEDLPNVFLLGHKDYTRIPLYLFHFDVCIIPFRMNQLTKATDPVKLYEYFTLGKPVVATDMPELRRCHDLLYIGKDPADFARQLDGALQETDRALCDRRIAFAAANTWASRIATIEAAMEQTFPLVSILIVTYNSTEFIAPCLDSIRRNNSYPHYEILIMDNDSTDGTQEFLRQHTARDPHIHLTCLESNKGFAAATNLAAAQARGEYLLLLNPDTVVTSGWVERLLRHIRRHPAIGLVSPVTNYAGNELRIDVDYRNYREMETFAFHLAQTKFQQWREIAMIPLFGALIPRTVWDQLGGLDERFEVGMFEDDDLSCRARQAGYRIVAAEDCFIHHFGQGSFAQLSPAHYDKLFARNQRRFEQKWNIKWYPYHTRANTPPVFEKSRYIPADFLPMDPGP